MSNLLPQTTDIGNPGRYMSDEYYEWLADSFVLYADRLPLIPLEWGFLILSAIIIISVIWCILTTGRRMFDNKRWMMKLTGWMLILNNAGQTTVAIALMTRALTGGWEEWWLLWGILAWVAGRLGIHGSMWVKAQLPKLNKIIARQQLKFKFKRNKKNTRTKSN